jgi:uncharacterized membrane protein
MQQINAKGPRRVPDAPLMRDGGLLRPAGLAAAGLLVAMLWTGSARAEFQVCNQTLDVVNVAIGQQETDAFRTEGWWTIGSNQCAKVIKDNLQTRFVYVFALDVFGQPLLDGTVPLCLRDEKFTIDVSPGNTASCWQQGYKQAKFVEVDAEDLDNWTLFLNDPGG